MLNTLLVLLSIAIFYLIKGNRESRSAQKNVTASFCLGLLIVGFIAKLISTDKIEMARTQDTFPQVPDEEKAGVINHTDHCESGEKDADESDVDCGGSCKQRCRLHQSCNTNLDCINYACFKNVCSPWFKIKATGCSIAFFSEKGKMTWYVDDELGVASRPEKDEAAAIVYCKNKEQICTVRTDYTDGKFIPCSPARQGKNRYFVLWNNK